MRSKITMHAAEEHPIIIRQGDVLLQPVPRVAKSFEAAPIDRNGDAVIAYGEATGHKHRFERAAAADGSALSTIYVHPIARSEVSRVEVKTAPQHLLHEEHSPHEIAPGSWRVSRPYEYEGTELPRMVAD